MLEIGPNLKELIIVGIGIFAFAWVLVTAFKNM